MSTKQSIFGAAGVGFNFPVSGSEAVSQAKYADYSERDRGVGIPTLQLFGNSGDLRQ